MHVLAADVAQHSAVDPFWRFVHRTQPRISVAGVVTAVDRFARGVVHTLEDPSGAVTVLSERATDTVDEPQQHPLGAVVWAVGRIRRRGPTFTLVADNILPQRDPGTEPHFWMQAIVDYAHWAQTEDIRRTSSV